MIYRRIVCISSLLFIYSTCVFFFFFQAEDGIRDWSVTGVQTCALPICRGDRGIRHPAPSRYREYRSSARRVCRAAAAAALSSDFVPLSGREALSFAPPLLVP